MSSGRAYIAVPLPATSKWRLLRDPSELPAGYVIVGQLAVGRGDQPALTADAVPALPSRPGTRLCPDCPLRGSAADS